MNEKQIRQGHEKDSHKSMHMKVKSAAQLKTINAK